MAVSPSKGRDFKNDEERIRMGSFCRFSVAFILLAGGLHAFVLYRK